MNSAEIQEQIDELDGRLDSLANPPEGIEVSYDPSEVEKMDAELGNLHQQLQAVLSSERAERILARRQAATEVAAGSEIAQDAYGYVIDQLGGDFSNLLNDRIGLEVPTELFTEELGLNLDGVAARPGTTIPQTRGTAPIVPAYQASQPRSMLSVVRSQLTDARTVDYMEETWDGTTDISAVVAEGGVIPETNFQWGEKTATLTKKGAEQPITLEMMRDIPGSRSRLNVLLQTRLRQQLDLDVFGSTHGASGIVTDNVPASGGLVNVVSKLAETIEGDYFIMPDVVICTRAFWQKAQNAGITSYNREGIYGRRTRMIDGLPVVIIPKTYFGSGADNVQRCMVGNFAPPNVYHWVRSRMLIRATDAGFTGNSSAGSIISDFSKQQVRLQVSLEAVTTTARVQAIGKTGTIGATPVDWKD